MKIHLITNGYEQHAALLRHRLSTRFDAAFDTDGTPIELLTDKTLGAPESYEIRKTAHTLQIIGTDELGLYYGIGKALHSAQRTADGITFLPTAGVVTPACDFRAIYYAVHFYNWYQNAPAEKLGQYLEDLLLWGYNTVICIIPVVNLDSFEDDLFHRSVATLRTIFSLAKRVGMRIGLILCTNQGLRTAPHELDAAPLAFSKLRGNLGRNLCLSKPGGRAYMEFVWRGVMTPFADLSPDYIIAWPYDEGGCGCERCRPWGSNMFCTSTKWLRDEARKLFPDVKIILSTWTFDAEADEGEYEGLYRRLADDMSFVDYLMVDSHGAFPRYALEHPPIKPIVNFPEISMWGLGPWGGFGANPLPERHQRHWRSAKQILHGGMPYSEGLYEDISKIQCVGYYWSPDRPWQEILAEYTNYEFSGEVVDEINELCLCIEKNHTRIAEMEDPDLTLSARGAELARAIDARLDERAKKNPRWRILYIRAILDEKRYAKFPFESEDPKRYRRFRFYSGDLLLEDAEAQAMFYELWGYYHCVPHNGENHHTLPPYGGTKLQVRV